MKIELKNIKHSEFASHETHCFEATVYVDGKRAFIAENEGYGGPDNYHPLKGSDYKTVRNQIAEIEKELGKEKIECHGTTMSNSLEIVINDLINDWLKVKIAKRLLKKITYIKDGNIYSMPAKHKPTPEMLERIKQQKWWKKSNIMLNELPLEEVVKHLK